MQFSVMLIGQLEGQKLTVSFTGWMMMMIIRIYLKKWAGTLHRKGFANRN